MPLSDTIGALIGEVIEFNKARASGRAPSPFMEAGYTSEDLISSFGQTYAHAKGASDVDAQKKADQNAWFLSAVLFIMGETASANLHIVEQAQTDDRPKDFPNHPFEQIYYRPNPHMTGDWMMRYTTLWTKSDGNGYWLLVTDKNDLLQEIWPLPSDAVYPIAGQEGTGDFIEYYEYHARGTIYKIHPRYICHFQNFPNKWNPFDGASELIAGSLPIDADTAMLRWNAKFFNRDNVMPNAIINLRSGTPAKRVAPADIAAIKSDLTADYAAINRKTFVTGAPGGIDVNMLGWSARDMDFVQGRAATKSEIYHLMGFPEGVLDPSATEASAKQAAKILKDTVWTRTLVPFAATITAKIIWPFYGKEYRAIYDDIRPVDRELVLKENDDRRRVATYDEARINQGYEPYTGPFKKLIALLPYELAVNPQFVAEAIKIERGIYDQKNDPRQPLETVASKLPQTPPPAEKPPVEEIQKAKLLRDTHAQDGMLSIDFPYQFAQQMYHPLRNFPGDAEIVPVWQRHLTLKYFPDLSLDVNSLKAALVRFFARENTFEITVGGEDRFFAGEKEVIHHMVFGKELYGLQARLESFLFEEGFSVRNTFANYHPHVTAAYTNTSEPLAAPLPEPGNFTVTQIVLHWGAEKTIFLLMGDAARNDLKTWREKVIKHQKAVSFESDCLPQGVLNTLHQEIAALPDFDATTVKALFGKYA